MARKIRKKLVDLKQFMEVFEEAYQEWKKWSVFHSHLPAEGLAMAGGRLPGSSRYEREVKKAYGQFDNAIKIIIAHNKLALVDPRVIERIEQAQWMGDTYFFEELAGAIKKNVGIDRRVAEDPAVGVIYDCAVKYHNGDKNCILEEYRRWEEMDIQARRRKRPRDVKFQSIVDHWEKGKTSIVGNGLENFRARVIRMAKQLLRGSMPIPIPINTKR